MQLHHILFQLFLTCCYLDYSYFGEINLESEFTVFCTSTYFVLWLLHNEPVSWHSCIIVFFVIWCDGWKGGGEALLYLAVILENPFHKDWLKVYIDQIYCMKV